MVTKKARDRKNADFKKVKLRVGRKLKKTNTTDTTVQVKKVVLLSQLNEKLETADQPLSFRGLSLDDLCKQLGHFNQNIRKDAIIGTKQLLTSRPDLIKVHLRTLIPSIARLISSSNNNPSLNAHLRALLNVICTVPSYCMSVHFKLFMAHVLRALSHMELSVRNFSLSILSTIMSSYRDLCRNDMELFTSFVKFLNSSKKPAWNAPRFLEIIKVFLNVYDIRTSYYKPACNEFKLAVGEGVMTGHINMVDIYSKINIYLFIYY
uniref:Ipi1_N domain-containing protein n=1 Tax=Heterorhabditis bacteriophora TaxID=37862 RepID=A0A1I7X4V7_HETBA